MAHQEKVLATPSCKPEFEHQNPHRGGRIERKLLSDFHILYQAYPLYSYAHVHNNNKYIKMLLEKK